MRIHVEHGTSDSPPLGIVQHKDQKRQAQRFGNLMTRHRVTEHVGAVAHCRDDKAIWLRELHTKPAWERPAETTRMRLLIPRPVILQRERIERATEFRQDGRTLSFNGF